MPTVHKGKDFPVNLGNFFSKTLGIFFSKSPIILFLKLRSNSGLVTYLYVKNPVLTIAKLRIVDKIER